MILHKPWGLFGVLQGLCVIIQHDEHGFTVGLTSAWYFPWWTKRSKWVFPKIGVPQNGWFISWKTLLKWMIWGYPYFWKHLNVDLIMTSPKDHWTLKTGYFEDATPAIQVLGPLPLEGPRSLGSLAFLHWVFSCSCFRFSLLMFRMFLPNYLLLIFGMFLPLFLLVLSMFFPFFFSVEVFRYLFC